ACSPTPASARRRSIACARSSASTPSAPAASAWLRSTRATWSTWRARWRRSAPDLPVPRRTKAPHRGAFFLAPLQPASFRHLGRHEGRDRVRRGEGFFQRLVLVAVLVLLALVLLLGRIRLPAGARRRRILAIAVGHALPRQSRRSAHACAAGLNTA